MVTSGLKHLINNGGGGQHGAEPRFQTFHYIIITTVVLLKENSKMSIPKKKKKRQDKHSRIGSSIYKTNKEIKISPITFKNKKILSIIICKNIYQPFPHNPAIYFCLRSTFSYSSRLMKLCFSLMISQIVYLLCLTLLLFPWVSPLFHLLHLILTTVRYFYLINSSS